MEKYVFRKYVPEYRIFFNSEKDRLENVLDSSAKIEHIGSTAIIGLGGKGILDVLIGVPENKMPDARKKLIEAGYEFRRKASTPERLFFRIDYPSKGWKRRVHVHLTAFNSKDWKEMIGFRNYLLKHPKKIDQYIKTKKEAVKKALGDGEVYRKHKEKFIKDVLKKHCKP